MKKKFILIIIALSILTIGFFIKNTNHNLVTKQEFYNFIKEAYITPNGYTKEISKHMPREIFDKVNAFETYRGNSTFKKPYKINMFELKLTSKRTILKKTYLNMIYSVSVCDANNKEIGGSWNIPVKYIIKKVNNTWYIFDKQEEA
ncbi:hypothetical protein ACFIJ5_18445 (plasmid) [Haloimpatiens sp. FM7330]|uniref:hypothetical protein n=1 Tax=Haloimpatiens sp. FM7330 TaxID=3298610 RepID=UPI0036406072